MATRGNRNDVWSSFDLRRTARANNSGDAAAAGQDGGEDTFNAAGVTAE